MYDEFDAAVYTWFINARAFKIPIDGKFICEKALQFARKLDPETKFSASHGWLGKFLNRHEISSKALSGEGAAVNQLTINEWFDNLKDTCANYDAKDIFNIDETGLFFNAKPKKSYVMTDDSCLGGRQSEKRLTVCLFTNAVGDKESPIIIIGNAKRPRAFGRLDVEKMFGIIWRHNRTAWMKSILFEEVLKIFNRKMRLQGRKVLLFLDNCTSHPHLELSNVQLVFLPPNTTSACQPLDQGIISAFKWFYRQTFVKDMVRKLDESMSQQLHIDDILDSPIDFKASVLDAITWISEAWKKVKPETIQKCFARCGFNCSLSTAEDQESEEFNGFDGILSAEQAVAFVTFDNNAGLTFNTYIDL